MNQKNQNYIQNIKDGLDLLYKSKEFDKQINYISNSIISSSDNNKIRC